MSDHHFDYALGEYTLEQAADLIRNSEIHRFMRDPTAAKRVRQVIAACGLHPVEDSAYERELVTLMIISSVIGLGIGLEHKDEKE